MSTTPSTKTVTPDAPADCQLCTRLVAFRRANQSANPQWFNGAVPSFGPSTARLLIVGLAPGLQGANRTGRPFTGDYAGDLLYSTLLRYGFAKGQYGADPNDGLQLIDCMITNAVRCVPPQNKPTPAEALACRPFFESRLAALPHVRVIMALGRIAHDQILGTMNLRKTDFAFAHGQQHRLGPDLALFDSFHCSRYNTNTGRLTPAMFHAVFAGIRQALD